MVSRRRVPPHPTPWPPQRKATSCYSQSDTERTRTRSPREAAKANPWRARTYHWRASPLDTWPPGAGRRGRCPPPPPPPVVVVSIRYIPVNPKEKNQFFGLGLSTFFPYGCLVLRGSTPITTGPGANQSPHLSPRV
jgi:hypothetical protein